jgi:hypothetical protein
VTAPPAEVKVMQSDRDWYLRNADRRNPNAFINTNPAYFGEECAWAIMNGTLARASTPSASAGELVEAIDLARIPDRPHSLGWYARVGLAQENGTEDGITELMEEAARGAITALTEVRVGENG